MVLEVSDEVLEVPPLPPEKRVFFPTRSEWIAISRRNQIIRAGISSIPTIFTVPGNSVLFMTSSWITAVGTATAGTATMNTVTNSITFHVLQTGASTASNVANNNTYPMPLLINSGEVVQIIAGNATGRAGFTGWLEVKVPAGNQDVP